jgi:hypothetical protein
MRTNKSYRIVQMQYVHTGSAMAGLQTGRKFSARNSGRSRPAKELFVVSLEIGFSYAWLYCGKRFNVNSSVDDRQLQENQKAHRASIAIFAWSSRCNSANEIACTAIKTNQK